MSRTISSPALIALLFLLTATATASNSPLISGANPDAAEGIAQYGQFVGNWTCASEFRNQQGEWQSPPAKPTWEWHYVLNGHAIQDVWMPDPEHAPPTAVMGTNLRVYDAEKNEWDMVWTTESSGALQHFSATEVEGNIVMTGNIPAGARPAHTAQITFHNIQADHFDWKYEAPNPDGSGGWVEFSRLACERTK